MAGLVGLRLAIYDELLRGGALDAAECARRLAGDGARSTALTDELPRPWPGSCHRLLVAHEGEWRAVILALARMNFESNGPANIAEATTPAPRPARRTRPHRRRATPPGGIFTLDGYREANGSTQ